MSTVLIFPPGVDPRAPHLALPSLAAWLRGHGETTHLLDLNQRAVNQLLRPERLEQATVDLRRRLSGRPDPTETVGRLALCGPDLAAKVEAALAGLRASESFHDALEFNAHREILIQALDLCSAAAGPGLSFNINPARYDVRGYDPQRLADLVAVTARPEMNLFHDDWHDQVVPGIDRLQPELVGISITNRQQLIPGLYLARTLRGRGHFTVLGGTVLAKFADALQRLPGFFEHFADAVVVYEGETALLVLLSALRAGTNLSGVPNLLYRDHGGQVRATLTHVEDINALPTPDFTGLDLDAYLAPAPVLPILTGKGCYFNRCKFCDIPYINHISRKAYRVRTVERIADDIESLADRFHARHFLITDEALSPRLLGKLADAMPEASRGRYSFTGYARLEPGFDAATCRKLAAMGMKKLYFGLESADQATLDHMDKGMRVSTAPAVLRNCAEAAIRFHLFSIIGFPQETEASARTTLQFFLDHRALIDHPGNSFDIHPFGLELRTDYFRDRADLGLEIEPGALDKDFVIGIDGADWHNPSGLSAERVGELLRTEFHPSLRETFRRYHATADTLWPGFEEYAALYASHYQSGDFPYRSSLPEAAAGQPVHLRWNPALTRLVRNDKVLLLAQDRFLLLDRSVHAALDERAVGDIAVELEALLANTGQRQAEPRRYLDWLLARGYLQLRLLERAPVRQAV